MCSRCLETSSALQFFVFQDVFKTSSRRLGRFLQDVLENEKLLRWRRVEDVFKTYLEDDLKTSWRSANVCWIRACVCFFRKRTKKGQKKCFKNTTKCKIFENLGKNVQNLKNFWKYYRWLRAIIAGDCLRLSHAINC